MSTLQGKMIGQNNLAEVLTGVAVVLAIVTLVAFGYLREGPNAAADGYEIQAKLAKVDGLGVGTDVRISGIKVGNISALTLDPMNYMVTVHMAIRSDVKIPTDSSLILTQSGVLGSQYISIQPGGDDKVLAAGEAITNTQSANSNDLMSLAGRFIGGGSTDAPKKPALPDSP